MSYVKVHTLILDSSIWDENSDVLRVWITILAKKNRYGEVAMTVSGLSRAANLGLDVTQEALDKFLAPDPFSRTKVHEGRRLLPIEGGWFVINHEKYRDLDSAEDYLRKNAQRQRRWREQQKTKGSEDSNVTVTPRDTGNDIQIQSQMTDTENIPLSPPGEKPRRRKIPDHWCFGPPHTELASRHGLAVHKEAQAFEDHAKAHGRLLVDWDRGFSMWLRKAAEFKSNGKQSPAPRQVRPDAPRGIWYAKHLKEREEARLEALKTPNDPGVQSDMKQAGSPLGGPAIAIPVPADDDEIPF